MSSRLLRSAALLGAGTVALAGCGFHGIYSLPLPGAAGNGKPSNTITVQFRDALDLLTTEIEGTRLVFPGQRHVCTVPSVISGLYPASLTGLYPSSRRPAR